MPRAAMYSRILRYMPRPTQLSAASRTSATSFTMFAVPAQCSVMIFFDTRGTTVSTASAMTSRSSTNPSGPRKSGKRSNGDTA